MHFIKVPYIDDIFIEVCNNKQQKHTNLQSFFFQIVFLRIRNMFLRIQTYTKITTIISANE